MLRAFIALVVTAGLLGIGAGPALAQGSVPVQGPQSYTLGTFNMAGGNKSHGDRGTTADALRRSITKRGADIVFLQEACRKMTDRMLHDLPRPWKGVFVATIRRDLGPGDRARPNLCIGRNGVRNGSELGIGIVYRSSRFKLAGTHFRPLPSAGLEHRMILCLDFVTPRRILACTTHLTAGGSNAETKNRREQTEEIIRFLSPSLSAGRAVLLGGDFNAAPDKNELDPLWDPRYGGGAFGPFIEVDSGPSQENTGYQRTVGFPTSGVQKIDYIFVRGATVKSGVVGRTKYSDHRPLWATVLH